MTKPVVGVAAGAIGVALLLAAAWVNFNVLTESYGAGPPYYSRTTNMDKWADPLPYLISFDIVVLALAVLAIRVFVRSIRAPRRHSDA